MEKSLLPVDGKPVIRIIVDNLRKCKKIGKIYICCLEKFKKQFEHEFRDIPSIEILDFKKPLGTYSTYFCANQFPKKWVMVHYADCLTEIDYDDFISNISKEWDGIIAITNTVKHDYSEVVVSTEEAVIEFHEKPFVHRYTWSGIGLFRTKAIDKYYNPPNSQDFAIDIFPKMMCPPRRGLKAYPYNGYWYDMGNLNSYRKVVDMFSKPSV